MKSSPVYNNVGILLAVCVLTLVLFVTACLIRLCYIRKRSSSQLGVTRVGVTQSNYGIVEIHYSTVIIIAIKHYRYCP